MVNGKDDIPYMMENSKHVWNHQPDLLMDTFDKQPRSQQIWWILVHHWIGAITNPGGCPRNGPTSRCKKWYSLLNKCYLRGYLGGFHTWGYPHSRMVKIEKIPLTWMRTGGLRPIQETFIFRHSEIEALRLRFHSPRAVKLWCRFGTCTFGRGNGPTEWLNTYKWLVWVVWNIESIWKL